MSDDRARPGDVVRSGSVQPLAVWQQPPPPRAMGLSLTSFVFSLVSLVLGFTVLLPLAGIVVGIVGLKREPTARGFAVTGIVINTVMMVGWVAFVLIMVFVVWAAGVGVTAIAPFL